MNPPRELGKPSVPLAAAVAANLRAFREARQLSQAAFADLCGLHRGYVGAIERAERNVSLSTLERVAAVMGISVAQLLSTDTQGMTEVLLGGGTLAGKAVDARRPARTSSPVARKGTGWGFRWQDVELVPFLGLGFGQTAVFFSIPEHVPGDLIGYGVWFWCTSDVTYTLEGGPDQRTLTRYKSPSWNKAGSIWRSPDGSPVEVTLAFTGQQYRSAVALYKPVCGLVQHQHLDSASPAMMRNLHRFAPEAIFIREGGAGEVARPAPEFGGYDERPLILKSCSRCGRFLPINVPSERHELSFRNHCVSDPLRPCKRRVCHELREVVDPHEVIELEYGFQLECRFCRRFDAN